MSGVRFRSAIIAAAVVAGAVTTRPAPGSAMIAPVAPVPVARAAPAARARALDAPVLVAPPRVVPHAAAVTVPLVLPPAIGVTGTSNSVLYRAMLAIAQAQQVDPQAAQTASFDYIKAVQQYRSGNFAGARISALAALSAAGSAQVRAVAPQQQPAAALLQPAPPQRPGTEGGLYGADAPAVDADSFLALARGTLADCAARHDRRLGAARQQLGKAQQDFAARDWEATRLDAKAAIDACAEPRQPR